MWGRILTRSALPGSPAALKTHQLATEPVLGAGLLDSRWFQAAVVQYEVLLGFWLISGLFPRAACWAALGTFGVFALAAAARGIAGEASCGCFGRVSVSPWLTLVIDVSAIVALCGCDLRWVRRGSASSTSVIPATGGQWLAEPQRAGLSGAFAWFVAVWLAAAISLGVIAVRGAASERLPSIGRRIGDVVVAARMERVDVAF